MKKREITVIRPSRFAFLLAFCVTILGLNCGFCFIKSVMTEGLTSGALVDLFFPILPALLIALFINYCIFGQKIVIKNNEMLVYSWNRPKWIFNLAYENKAEYGFYYKEWPHNRKIPSIQVKTESGKTCFPIHWYSTKQMRTVLFTLNNSTNNKFYDTWLQGQEKYLMHESLVMAVCPKESRKRNHCEFCRTEFGCEGGVERGYASKDRRRWICEKCFEDFKDMFHFRAIQNRKSDRIKD